MVKMYTPCLISCLENIRLNTDKESKTMVIAVYHIMKGTEQARHTEHWRYHCK